MSVLILVVAATFASGFGSAIGFIVALYARDFIRRWLVSLEGPAKSEQSNPLPGCVVCQNTRVPIKAKGKCKRCYERIGGRERRARAKSSSKR